MRLGLSSYTYTWAVGLPGSMPSRPMTPFDLIDKAVAAGLSLVQIADNMPVENLSVEELRALYNYSQKKDVAIELGSRGLTREHTLKCLDTAWHLQSPILRMVIDKPGFEPDLNTTIDLVRDLLPEFRSRGIMLAIENHDRFKANEFEEIIRSTDSEWVGICLDSVNSMGAGEGFETVSEILIPYTINLHIKDFTIFRVSHKMGFIIEGRPAGQGMLNIQRLSDKLSSHDRCHSAILELWTPPGPDPLATIAKEDLWASQSIDYLKKIFK